ncbi:hypothetical protein F5X99DRAFT_332267 [Biscogniauxia marginata]|nr:hypothetical protein F5X99DRAFT_332267 [Biscogniauxia marginata]
MPAKSPSNGSAAGAKRFELPLLDFKFGSLTDGTDIPPPPPSPKEEIPTPPKTPTYKVEEPKKQEENGAANGHGTPPSSDITITTGAGVKRPAEDVPASPTPSGQGSLRRLISKTLLNHAYDEQGSIISQSAPRPVSRPTSSIMTEEKRAKRSSGWFRRLRHSGNESANSNKRTSQIFEEPKKPAGPPPPKIPELSDLKTKVDTHLGDDLFKEIK